MAEDETQASTPWEFSVIVPFFQRKRGILIKAVKSALAQEGIATPRVIVIDDGSPVRAVDELDELLGEYPQQLIILHQENGGPGAARNRGIAHAQRDSKYVAFLDSDDQWGSAHLATAKRALDRGFDFYFCDAVHRDGARTLFETREIPAAERERIDGEQDVFEYTGDLFERVLTGCPIQATAVVYRASAFPLTFRTELRTAGEDHFFWLEVADRKRKTVLCTSPNVQLGYGVNIYNGVDWGSPEMLWRVFYDQTCIKSAASHFAACTSHEPVLRARRRQYRRDFIHNMISAMSGSRRGEVLPVAIKYFSVDRLGVFWIPLILLGRASTHVRDVLKAR